MKVLIDLFWSKYAELRKAVEQNDVARVAVLDRDLDPLLEAIISRSTDDINGINAQFQFAMDLLNEEADDCGCVQRNVGLLRTLVDRYVAAGNQISPLAGSAQDAVETGNILDEGLLDSISDCVSVITPSYRISYSNEANARRQGIAVNDVVGRHIAEFVGLHRFQQGFKEKLDLCFQGQTLNYTYAEDVDGRTIVLSCNMSPCYSSRNRLAGAMVVVQEREDRRKRTTAA